MQKPEWTKIGSVEVCVGTDGAVGIAFGPHEVCVLTQGLYHGWQTKEVFEQEYCKPRHRLIESCDGSVCVVSTEEQGGKPVRMAIVRHCAHDFCVAEWANHGGLLELKQDAIHRAARYVETGE